MILFLLSIWSRFSFPVPFFVSFVSFTSQEVWTSFEALNFAGDGRPGVGDVPLGTLGGFRVSFGERREEKTQLAKTSLIPDHLQQMEFRCKRDTVGEARLTGWTLSLTHISYMTHMCLLRIHMNPSFDWELLDEHHGPLGRNFPQPTPNKMQWLNRDLFHSSLMENWLWSLPSGTEPL